MDGRIGCWRCNFVYGTCIEATRICLDLTIFFFEGLTIND